MENTTKIKNGKLINCPAMFNQIIEGLGDLSETKKFYIFYASDNANTISYIKSMGRITKYNIEIEIINLKECFRRNFINITKKINDTNSKYIILKPIDDIVEHNLRFVLNSNNEVDKNDELTVEAVMYILKTLKIEPQAFLMIGRHLGKKIALKLLENDFTPIIGHSKTKELKDIMKWCKLIISTAGSKDLVKMDLIQDGAIVIDVGLGDLEEAAYNKCYFTPRVNGVGLVTTAMLVKEIRS